jgi:hypothetical protein
MSVHVKDNGEEEPEKLVELKSGESFELPFPLQKEAGEEEDAWAMKDSKDKTVLKLRFTLPIGGFGITKKERNVQLAQTIGGYLCTICTTTYCNHRRCMNSLVLFGSLQMRCLSSSNGC